MFVQKVETFVSVVNLSKAKLRDFSSTLPLSQWVKQAWYASLVLNIIEPQHEISNNVVCASSKASDQPAHTHSLIRAFASRLNIL